MNLDDALQDEDGYSAELREHLARQFQKKQQQRKSFVSDGRGIFQCTALRGVGTCEKAIASTEVKDGRTRFKIMLRGQIKDNEDITQNLGGRCEQCETVHNFHFEEVAQTLGFTDCASALRALLKEGEELHSDSKRLAAGFLACYVHRKDDRWQARESIKEQAFVKKASVWLDDEENDPFGDK